MADSVPVYKDLASIYSEDALPTQKPRWEHLLAKFEQKYQRKAEFVSRSPGRVNIIGEHVDYNLYSVLPMAITADMLIAVATSPAEGEATIRISNVLEKFKDRTFQIKGGDVEIDASELEWSNYLKAGLKAALQLLQSKNLPAGQKPVSLDIMVDGTVPAGGGLSSSAAFVCASTLAAIYANGLHQVDKIELTDLAIVSERFAGVNAGGMDQAASVFGVKNHALNISFTPSLKAKAVAFPKTTPALTFIIANTLVTADKHTTAPVNYNLRVVETALAAEILAKKYGLTLPQDKGPLGISLRGFHDAYYTKKNGKAADPNSEEFDDQLQELCQKIVTETFTNEEGYTHEETAKLLGISVDEMSKRFMSRFPVKAEKFLLHQRAFHTFAEALRVKKFLAICETTPSETLERLGGLMNASQISLRRRFHCSCTEIDLLTAIALEHGAYGSRLTGAGWGGCTVHLVGEDKVEAVKKAMVEEYYKKKFPKLTDAEIEEAIVVTKPGGGACVWPASGQL
ncbi:Galactokinase [Ascobolus immersus RN42]|uniref:Galactokinase n=1 Tax=Ascobolus immersus RN42 TaxID=1160509 RepID=A0A3N4IIF4_ASCIM|nr:Galactokinase [Ascobolus immersus RN42]